MSVDDDLLSLLQSAPFDIYDGHVDVDETDKVIAVPLPYAVFYSSTGDDYNRRLCGTPSGRLVDFQLTTVGATRQQVKWAAAKTHALLDGATLNRALITHQSGRMVRRDDDYTRPGGEPIFYGIDTYSVPVRH